MEENRIKELFLGLILITFLILLSFLVIATSNSYSTSSSVVSNSYNVNSYNTNPSAIHQVPLKTYYNKQNYFQDSYGDRVYLSDKYSNRNYPKSFYTKSNSRYLRYSENSYLRKTPRIFGTDINSYEVYVKNRDHTGGYFTVKYYFQDYYGNVFSEPVTHYIKPGYEKRFVYKDVSQNRHEYKNLRYEVFPASKTYSRSQSKNHYTRNNPGIRIYDYNQPTRTYFYLN